MLNNLIKEWARVRVANEMVGNKGTEELAKVLHNVTSYLSSHDWKCDPATIDNNTWAMCMFFEMFAYKIGGDTPAMMCYYFSSLVANDKNIPENQRLEGNKYRAFIVFKNMSKWDDIITMARLAPMYKGNLDASSFLDILLLSDVYKAWDVDPNSAMLTNLKNQAPNVARNHPNITKQQSLVEGSLAHEVLFSIIKDLVVS